MEFFDFEIEMQGDCTNLPPWIGSAIRGAIGTELIKRCCVFSSMDCENCPEIFSCSAKALLYTAKPSDGELGTNPYLIRNYRFGGDRILFEIVLFGNGISCAGDIFRVLMKGLSIYGNSFKLCSVKDLFSGEQIFTGMYWSNTKASPLLYKNLNNGELTFYFSTPWISKSNQKRTDFDYLLRACTRRATSAMKCCGEDINIDFTSLFSLAKSVETVSEGLESKAISRYSSRTDRKMELNGYIGQITYKGDFAPFQQILSICELIGVGKMCVMGLGQFNLEQNNL